jgi:hypothetical protein
VGGISPESSHRLRFDGVSCRDRRVRREDAVAANEIDVRFEDAGGESGHEVQGLEEHVGGAIAIRGFELGPAGRSPPVRAAVRPFAASWARY